MKYLYTSDNCSACVAKKESYKSLGVSFEERDADRIKRPEDDIDLEALVQASMQNMVLPVEVEK